KLHVPVGIIVTCWGGTTIQAWMDKESLQPFPGIYIPTAADPLRSPEFDHPHAATLLFNSMIRPIEGYGIKGFIWYQGEANRFEPVVYQKAMPAMIKRWREVWKSGDLPFYYVQIAPYGYAGSNDYYSALLRESQLKAMNKLPNCGMAVLTDAGKKTRIHPPDKTVVAQRLSYWALAKTYHRPRVRYAGPVLKREKIRGDSAYLYFDNAEDGLVAPDGKLACFEVAGDDRVFYPANAVIRDKNQVVVESDRVKKPLSVRYAFKNWVQGDLYNKAGLPASSFRTNSWEPKPNVVLIDAYRAGYGDPGCYGATRFQTPNIDRIAGSGIRFTNAHDSSGADTTTLLRMFQTAGYQTAVVGSTQKAQDFIVKNWSRPFVLDLVSGDAIPRLDSSVGQLRSTLDSMELSENTIFAFVGGNRGVPDAGKRVPFVVSWYGRVKAGTVSDALISRAGIFRFIYCFASGTSECRGR
ncbi:MAG TPA: sialate O-acetylesterase, partial [Puia sp.]|nr:sialate O-acetylesterase [Puia sp.]